MNKNGRSVCVLLCVAALSQLGACSSEVAASEAVRFNSVWHGYQADIRIIVYDDMNPCVSKRKFALHQDTALADDTLSDQLRALVPVSGPLHCAEDGKVYVLEVAEVGDKRRYSSSNNACGLTGYAGYLPTESLAQLARAFESRAAD